MGSTPSSFTLCCPQQSFLFFTFPTPLCAQFIDLPWWSRPGDGYSPRSHLSSSILTLSSVSPSPGSTCLQNRSPRSLWGGCTLVRPRPTTCGRKANPTQTRGEEQRHLLQAVLSSQGLWMSQSPAWGVAGPSLALLVCVEEKRCLLWPQEWLSLFCEGLRTGERDTVTAWCLSRGADSAVPSAGRYPDLSPLLAGISCSW